MPRQSRKYRALQSALKLTGGTAAPASPAANYLEFKAGRRKLNQRKAIRLSGALMQRLKVRLYPFEQPETALDGLVPISRNAFMGYITRSSDFFRRKVTPTPAPPAGTTYPVAGTGGTISDAEAGYLGDTVTATENGSYFSAILRCNFSSGIPVNRTNSGVTGRDYKARPNTIGASIPFGRTAAAFATSTQQNRFIFLSKELKGGLPDNASMTVSLTPEEFADSQRDAGFLTAT